MDLLLLLLFLVYSPHASPANHPIVTISPLLNHRFSVGIPCIIHINFLYPPTPYQSIIQWDDRDVHGAPITTNLPRISTTTSTASHTYTSKGLRVVNVTLSTGSLSWFNHTNRHIALNALDSHNSVSKSYSFTIYVDPHTEHCYTYTAPAIHWEPTGTYSADIKIQITDPTLLYSNSMLVDALSAMGHLPSISVSNATQSQPLSPVFDPFTMTWAVSVDQLWFTNGPSQTSLSIDSNDANLFGCAIKKSSTFPISPLFATGPRLPVMASVAIPPRVNEMRIVYHPCRPAHGLAFFSPAIAKNPVYVTTSSWTSTTIYSLSTILCEASQCSNELGVLDLQFTTSDTLVYVTTHGLFQSSASFGNIVRLNTGIAALDSPTDALQFVKRGCFEDLVMIRSSTRIYWWRLGDLPGNWASSTPVPSGYVLVNAIHSEIDLPNVLPRLLVANTQSNRFGLMDVKSGNVLLSSFPERLVWTPGIVISVIPDVDGQQLFLVMGSVIYRSYDKGYTWHFAFKLPMDLTISRVGISPVRNAIAFLSHYGLVFSGRIGAALTAIAIPSTVQYGGTPTSLLMDLNYDLDGGLYLLVATSLDDGTSLSVERIPLGTIESSGVEVGAEFEINPGRVTGAHLAIALNPVGVRTWNLRLVNAFTGGSVPGSWDGTSPGMVVMLHSDPYETSLGFLLTQVSLDGAEMLAEALGQSVLKHTSRTIPSAIGSTINIAYDGSTNQVQLVLSTSGKYWTTKLTGCTVVINGIASVYVTNIQSLTAARGVLISPPLSILGITDSSTWQVFDFRAQASFGMPATQTVQVSGSSAGVGEIVSLSTNTGANHFLFDPVVANAYVTFRAGNAKLRILACPTSLSATAVVVTPMAGLLGTSYSADEVFIFYGHFFVPEFLSACRSWSIYPPECPLRQLETKYAINNVPTQNHVQYLMSTEFLSIEYTAHWVPEQVGRVRRGYAMGSLYNSVTDIDMYQISAMQTEDDYSALRPSTKSRLTLGGNTTMLAPLLVDSKGIHSVLKVHPAWDSVLCRHTVPSVRIISGCDPQYRLQFMIPGVGQIALSDDLVFPNGQSMVQQLPTNYRPPSLLGVAVPNSTYIYNADPSAPRFNDFFAVSQSTGEFQQCKDRSHRIACQCTELQKRSMSIRDSDCIEKVLRIFQQSTLPLSLQLVQGLSTDLPVTTNMTVTELNRRQDWCIMTIFGTCTFPDWNYAAVADPSVNGSISFQGGQLYHFRVSVVVGSYCDLALDIPVYVINAEPLPTVHQSTMTIAAVCFCIWLLAIYLWYSFKQG